MSAPTTPAPASSFYKPASDPVLIEVPAFDFVMVDGRGDPRHGPAFQEAISAVYSFSYPVVIALKHAGRDDLRVGPLEALWWADEVSVFDPATEDRAAWQWTVMIRQPDDIPADALAASWRSVVNKVGADVAQRVRLARFDEGLCVQLMHIGPYSEECPRIAAMHDFVAGQGLRLRGRHHEIYLTDPRHSLPSKMRTILRHPVDE
ncbi:MAG TPA: GyrI-like domain-containing protein [Ilumatobacteraceae bacterium]